MFFVSYLYFFDPEHFFQVRYRLVIMVNGWFFLSVIINGLVLNKYIVFIFKQILKLCTHHFFGSSTESEVAYSSGKVPGLAVFTNKSQKDLCGA